MQDLSASELLSIELGFQTARDELDEEEEDNDEGDRFVDGGCEHPKRHDTSNSSRARESIEQKPATDEQRRISLTGTERANRWRLDGELRRDQTRLGASRRLTSGDMQLGVNNGQNFLAKSTGGIEAHQAASVKGDHVGLMKPAIAIHRVDTLGNEEQLLIANEQHPKQYLDQAQNQHHVRRSSSSFDLRSYLNSDREFDQARDGTMEQGSEQNLLLLSVFAQDSTSGSLSDGAYKLTKYPKGPTSKLYKPFSKHRFEAWKRTNRIITNIHANPIGLHLECLDQLNEESGGDSKQPHSKSVREQTTQTGGGELNDEPKVDELNQPKDLSNYANNLSCLYMKNRESMDSSGDFRSLLYNIICCLLVQDEQVLGTASVGKMLEVIRTHLDSASRVYAHTSGQLLRNWSLQVAASPGDQQQVDESEAPNGMSPVEAAIGNRDDQSVSSSSNSDSGPQLLMLGAQASHAVQSTNDQSDVQLDAPRREKPVDFRRISSVSYNDEQLIKDLRVEHSGEAHPVPRRSGSLGHCKARQPSPWAYRELSDRPNQLNATNSAQTTNNTSAAAAAAAAATTVTAAGLVYTSQSSLEQTMNNSDGPQMNDLTNDSGHGTMCDSQVVSDSVDTAGRRRGRLAPASALQSSGERRAISLCSDSFKMIGSAAGLTDLRSAQEFSSRLDGAGERRRLSDFKPMQQPSYMSTDDYLSTTNNNLSNTNRTNPNCRATSLYEDENSSAQLQKCDFHHHEHQQQGGADQFDDSDQADDNRKCSVDAAARRAELEWTLNKLINIELKLTWLTSKDTLRRAIRKIGVPNEIRCKVWLILIDRMIGTKYDVSKLIELANETIELMNANMADFDEETQSILKQIELDVNRTMPGHRLFDDGAEGGVKLRRILVAYSIHVNRAIAYCQGFNFIVALMLSVFEGDESKALRGFICIVDHIFPSKYYFDHYLTGARADQFLLADFICDQLIKSPTLAERKMVEGVTSSITLNWFISLFHGAVPTLVTPPSSCEIFTTIRNTARDMYDIKLLLSIVDQIKLPRDSYFAIRRSFYMVQSSFNSDQFYMQTLSNETSRSLAANKPLSCQQQLTCPTKPPSLSLISSAASNLCQIHDDDGGGGGGGFGRKGGAYHQFTIKNSVYQDLMQRPRTLTSLDRSKICVQSIGKLGRSHLRIIDANTRTNERSLMSPLRNCTLIGISNCGKELIIARQSSRRNFRSFKEQDLTFNIHEITNEIFDGFYLEETQQVLIITHQGEIFKIDHGKCLDDNKMVKPNYLECCTETLLLRNSGIGSSSSTDKHEKVKLRLSTMDNLTNLLWIYIECEETLSGSTQEIGSKFRGSRSCPLPNPSNRQSEILPKTAARFKHNNPFLKEDFDGNNSSTSTSDTNSNKNICPESRDLRQELRSICESHRRGSLFNKSSYTRKIIIVDIITFDLFSAFAVHPNFGEITNLKASLVAFCQLSNPMSNQFSTRIVQIGPTGRYEQLLSFSDVADYIVNVPDSFKKRYRKQTDDKDHAGSRMQQQRCSSLRRFLPSSISFSSGSDSSKTLGAQVRHGDDRRQSTSPLEASQPDEINGNTLTRYYRSLMRSYSSNSVVQASSSNLKEAPNERGNKSPDGGSTSSSSTNPCDTKPVETNKRAPELIQDGTLRSIVTSSFGDFSELSETNYIPVNMAFIFRNGKIALFEFTETYAIHTREAQLDRYDYSRVIDVTKNGEDFIVTILTICDKLIKVII